MSISRILGININNISKIAKNQRTSIFRIVNQYLQDSEYLQVISYYDYPDSWWYPPYFIYIGSGYLWASYGNSSNAKIVKLSLNDLSVLSTLVIDTGGSNWGWSNKTNNDTYLFSGSPSWNAVRINLNDLSWQKFTGSLNTPNGCRIINNYLWIGTWYTTYKFDPSTLSIISTINIGTTKGFTTDGYYVFGFQTSGTNIYKIDPNNNTIVATLNLGENIKNDVQDNGYLCYNGYLYVITEYNKLVKININTFTVEETLNFSFPVYGMVLINNFLYITSPNNIDSKILKYDILNNQFIYVSEKKYNYNLYTIRYYDNYFYIVCDNESGNKRIIKTLSF